MAHIIYNKLVSYLTFAPAVTSLEKILSLTCGGLLKFGLYTANSALIGVGVTVSIIIIAQIIGKIYPKAISTGSGLPIVVGAGYAGSMLALLGVFVSFVLSVYFSYDDYSLGNLMFLQI